MPKVITANHPIETPVERAVIREVVKEVPVDKVSKMIRSVRSQVDHVFREMV